MLNFALALLAIFGLVLSLAGAYLAAKAPDRLQERIRSALDELAYGLDMIKDGKPSYACKHYGQVARFNMANKQSSLLNKEGFRLVLVGSLFQIISAYALLYLSIHS